MKKLTQSKKGGRSADVYGAAPGAGRPDVIFIILGFFIFVNAYFDGWTVSLKLRAKKDDQIGIDNL